jgi:putative SOS response-associated peptidase YedK
MPAILTREAGQVWLDRGHERVERAAPAISTFEMVCYPVSKAVNNPRNNRPKLIVPGA